LAFVHLGQLLHYGTGGIPKDPQQAFGLFQLTADQGFDKGQCWVGDCYKMSPDGGGVPSCDVEIYFCWHHKAAEQGKIFRAVDNGGCSLLNIARENYGGTDEVGKNPIPQALFWFRNCQRMVVQLKQRISNKSANCSLPNDTTRKRLSRCIRCKAVCYCGPDCQKMHWKAGHKIDCYISSKK